MQPTQRDQGKCSLSTIVALHTGHQYTWQRSCLSRHSMHRHTCRHRKTRDGIIPQCILKRPWLKHTSEIKPSGIGVARNNSGTLLRYSPIWLCHSWPKLEYISLFWEAVQSVSMRIDYEVINNRNFCKVWHGIAIFPWMLFFRSTWNRVPTNRIICQRRKETPQRSRRWWHQPHWTKHSLLLH